MGRSISDIVTAVDNNLFADQSIKNGIFVRDNKGSLFRKVGGFAVNFRLLKDEKMWAIRCWHIPIKESQDHYKKVCSFLEDANLPYLLPTKYIENGIIHLDGVIAPITQMQWIDGETIKDYIVAHKNDKERMLQLADKFLDLCESMHLNHIAHGDLQHGNILIDNQTSVYLIDYDSFYSPNMGDKKRDEITGLKDYQHPARPKNKFANERLDYFSEVVIFLSIVAIAENPKLADTYKISTSEHLLFTSTDFADFKNSNIYKDIATLGEKFRPLLAVIEEYLSKNDILELYPIESYLTNSKFNYSLAAYIEQEKVEDDNAWKEALKLKTLEAYERYLAKFPKGRHCKAAFNRRKKILDEQEQEREDKLWLEATTKNSIVFYAKYLRESVLKTHVTEANVAIYTLQKQQAQDEEEKLWEKAVKSNTIASYQSYLSTSTLKKYTTEAESRIRAIDEANWTLACKISTIDAYNAYLKTFPTGLHVADAKRKIESITNKTKNNKKWAWGMALSFIFICICVISLGVMLGPQNDLSFKQYDSSSKAQNSLTPLPKDEENMNEMLEAMEYTKSRGGKVNAEMLKKAEDILPRLVNSPKYSQYKQRLNRLKQ